MWELKESVAQTQMARLQHKKSNQFVASLES